MLDTIPIESSVYRLRSGEPVYFAPDSCLATRRPGYECGVCEDVCPSKVLVARHSSISLEGDRCVGCGLCAVVCPTGALTVENCALVPGAASDERISLECRRVMPSDRDANAVAVPCLGGVGAADLLDLLAEPDKRIEIEFIDRGWCESCAVGRCNAPWQSTLDETRTLLGALDPQAAERITVTRKELPPGRAQPVVTALRPDKQVGRRDFFRRLMGVGAAHASSSDLPPIVLRRGRVSARKRQRILERIGGMAAGLGMSIPSALMPAIKIADGCDLDGSCAAICPTAALRREESGDSVSLRFDRSDCIACGLCERACVAKALSFWSAGDGDVPGTIETLASRNAATCARCGEFFVAAGDASLCAACGKDIDIARVAHTLTRGRAHAADAGRASAP